MKNIFILLPHKDQFIKSYSGSASIWVKDFYMVSKFKKIITVFGSTKKLSDIIDKKIYKNLSIPNIKYGSRTKIYVNKFKKYVLTKKPSIIEIHNRPTYLLELYKINKKANYILIIHNDPQNLKGSSSIVERENILKICKFIYFYTSHSVI